MKIREMVFATVMALLTVGLLTTAVTAAEDAGKKFTRGAINATTGWAELPYQVATQTSDNPYRGMTYGFMDGVSRGVQRTLYGTWDFLTFMVPPSDKPVMQPETVFGDTP